MFSIIMPVYNHARFVADAVESVFAQDFADWELLIVDDGSTDGSAEIVDGLARGEKRVKVVHQANAGPAAARNVAIDGATGEWLAFLDSDDIWTREALRSYADHISAHHDAEFIHGYRHRMQEDGSVSSLAGEFQDRPVGTVELFQRMFLQHMCVCYRRRLFEQTGRFNEALRCCEDYELYLRMSLHCRFEPLGVCVGWHRRHASNISRQTGYTRMVEAMVLRRFVERLGGRDVIDPDIVARRLGKLYYAAARQYFKARYYRQAAAAAGLSRRYRPPAKNAIIGLLSWCLRGLGRSDGRDLPDI